MNFSAFWLDTVNIREHWRIFMLIRNAVILEIPVLFGLLLIVDFLVLSTIYREVYK